MMIYIVVIFGVIALTYWFFSLKRYKCNSCQWTGNSGKLQNFGTTCPHCKSDNLEVIKKRFD
jgi:predicted Zn-ribbon and HTH transcriptional regulator